MLGAEPLGQGVLEQHHVPRTQPVGDLAWTEASYDSIHGKISVRWERAENKTTAGARKPAKFTLKLTVPTNTTASASATATPDPRLSDDGPVPDPAELTL